MSKHTHTHEHTHAADIKVQNYWPKICWPSMISKYESTHVDEQSACSEKPNDFSKIVLLNVRNSLGIEKLLWGNYKLS